MLTPRDIRNLRPAAGGDEDVLGAVLLAVDLDGIGPKQASMGFEQLDAAVDQQVAVDAVEARDLAVLVADQGFPVEIGLLQRPAVTLGLFEVIGEMRAVDEQFFRHAADVDAGAAQVTALGHRHFRPETRGEARSAHTTGTGTNYKQIEIVGHLSVSLAVLQHTRVPCKNKKATRRWLSSRLAVISKPCQSCRSSRSRSWSRRCNLRRHRSRSACP
ncbi:hypothetical protein D3C80_1401700 [compost metagenome]